MIIRKKIPGATALFDYEPTPGKKFITTGVDIGQARDHTAVVAIETVIEPLPDCNRATRKQLLDKPKHTVVGCHRLKLGLDYELIIEHIADVYKKLSDDKDNTFILDATGVGKPVAHSLRSKGTHFEEVIWTAGDSYKQSLQEWKVGKSYLVGSLGAALSSGKLKILEDLRDRKELISQFDTFRIEHTKAGNMTVNAAPGSNDDLISALCLAWFGVGHCTGSLGPPRDIVW